MRFWIGEISESCNLCGEVIVKEFVDGRIKQELAWAYMCLACHAKHGVGIGTGLGQVYQKQGDNFVLLTEQGKMP